jgi:nicotinate-nucleotide pyrophosphorylase (carboxylating)
MRGRYYSSKVRTLHRIISLFLISTMATSRELEGGSPREPTTTTNFSAVLPPHWKREVEGWIRDDVPSIDIGGLVVGDKPETAHLYGKSRGILAGVPFFDAVFEQLGCTVEWNLEEGALVDPAAVEGGKVLVAVVRGPARMLLLGERTALNTLSRGSGVATAAAAAAAVGRQHGWHGSVAGTRKTTPGFRIVEKYCLLVGGAATHRLDLSNMVMLKDNHIWSAGSITGAVKLARQAAGFTTKIEVEARTLEEGLEAAGAGADIVMLDNFEPEGLKAAAASLKAAFPHVICEASGGITLETMPDYFSPAVDVISSGKLTQGYSCLDYSLKISH